MKIAILQSGNSGFFPRFYKNLHNAIKFHHYDVSLFSPRSGVNHRNILIDQIFWGGRLNWHIHNLLYKITGLKDVFSTLDTLDLIRKLSKFKPDIIHFHVIGEGILNLPLLMRFLVKKKIKIVWTMHDCRAFTGGCPYFDEIGCYKWKTGCGNCPDTHYRSSKIDKTNLQWKLMKRTLAGLDNLTIVTPSLWLQKFVKESFLKDYECKLIYNGLDISAFSCSDGYAMRKQLNLLDKKIILGVAASWTARKGLDSFKYLAKYLPPEYQIVLVGNINEEIPNIIKLPSTSNIKLLADYYNMADIFCNPTLADNFPTTNIEALAAGTPVVTYKTGGSPEALDNNTGIMVEKGNKKELLDAIIKMSSSLDKFSEIACKKRSECFGLTQYNEYVSLYNKILNG